MEDRKYICPCDRHKTDIAETGHCICHLFVSDDYEPEPMAIPLIRDEDGAGRSIVVYGASWCTDTIGTVGFLNRSGIPYTYVDVDRDPEAAAKVERLNRGHLSTPTLDIEGQIVTEPSDEQLAEVLGLT